jgi:adenylate kinase family enzyme
MHRIFSTLYVKGKKVQTGTLLLFSGKMGAGKSTMSKQLAQERSAVLISEDEWLSALYPSKISSFDDYLHYSAILRPLIKDHVMKILAIGSDVIMDFPANTINQRKWFKELISAANAQNILIYLNVSDKIYLEQIEKRRMEQPERAVYDTESMFIEVTKYFQAPDEREGFNIQVIKRDS